MRLRLAVCLTLGITFALGSCRWSDVPPDAIYKCDNGSCPDDYTCQASPLGAYCVLAASNPDTCQPRTCAQLGTECGEIDDGCHGTVQCGDCGDGGVCRGGSCCQLPAAAPACLDAGHACGPLEFKACGKVLTLSCGGCNGGEVCEVNEFESSCVACVPENDDTLCARLGATCGTLSANDNCGMPRNVNSCGVCEDGGCGSAAGPNLCACQPLLLGCVQGSQCCSGTCGDAGLCCVANGGVCSDGADCCRGDCELGFCVFRGDGGLDDGRN